MIRKVCLILLFTLFILLSSESVFAQSCTYKSYGDANCDGVLTSDDYVIWKSEYLKEVASITSDFSKDTKVSLIDLEIFIRYLLNGLPSLSSVPSGQPSATGSVSITSAVSSTPSTVPSSMPTIAATSTPVPGNATYPAQVLDLTNWKVTVPIGDSESPTEKKQPELATYKLDPWFVVNPAGGVRFRAPVSAVTTGGSNYPRSELREMINNGKDNADWGSDDGKTHTMILDQAITAVPKIKKHIVAGQIHDNRDDVIVIRLEYPKLFIDINGTDGPTLNSNYVLGTRFTVKFVAQNGQTKIYYNNSSTPAYTLDQVYSHAYFKAGAYTQSNCNSDKEGAANCTEDNYGEVIVYGVTVTHQ